MFYEVLSKGESSKVAKALSSIQNDKYFNIYAVLQFLFNKYRATFDIFPCNDKIGYFCVNLEVKVLVPHFDGEIYCESRVFLRTAHIGKNENRLSPQRSDLDYLRITSNTFGARLIFKSF